MHAVFFTALLKPAKWLGQRWIWAFMCLSRPYLAPVPYRGKTNNPSYVPLVAQQIAAIRQQPLELIAEATSRNFEQLFTGVTE